VKNEEGPGKVVGKDRTTKKGKRKVWPKKAGAIAD